MIVCGRTAREPSTRLLRVQVLRRSSGSTSSLGTPSSRPTGRTADTNSLPSSAAAVSPRNGVAVHRTLPASAQTERGHRTTPEHRGQPCDHPQPASARSPRSCQPRPLRPGRCASSRWRSSSSTSSPKHRNGPAPSDRPLLKNEEREGPGRTTGAFARFRTTPRSAPTSHPKGAGGHAPAPRPVQDGRGVDLSVAFEQELLPMP